MRLFHRAAGLSMLALLAGCSWFGGGETRNKLTCPATEIAPDLDALTVLRPGGGTSTDDIRFGVKLVAVNSNCESEKVGLRTDTRMTFMVARNDPDLRQGEFTYFVAVADARRNILAKQNFTLRVEFAQHQNEMRVFDDISEHLPVSNLSNGADYAIIVGLQLTPEQLELNRKRNAP